MLSKNERLIVAELRLENGQVPQAVQGVALAEVAVYNKPKPILEVMKCKYCGTRISSLNKRGRKKRMCDLCIRKFILAQ